MYFLSLTSMYVPSLISDPLVLPKDMARISNHYEKIVNER